MIIMGMAQDRHGQGDGPGHCFLGTGHGTTRLREQILNDFSFWHIKLIHKKNHGMTQNEARMGWTGMAHLTPLTKGVNIQKLHFACTQGN